MKNLNVFLLPLCFFFFGCDQSASVNQTVAETVKADIQIDDTEVMASFNLDGVEHPCKLSTQYFGSNKETDNFSVLCQQDEPFFLLQAVFANEKNVRSGAVLKSKGGSYKVGEGEFGLSVTEGSEEYSAKSAATGTLQFVNNELVIVGVELIRSEQSNTKIVSAKLPL